jgi:hypothetical protein
MVALIARQGVLDRLAIGLSGLCIVHCLASAVFLAVVSSIGGAVALGRGLVEHGFMLPSAIGALGLGIMAGALELPHDGSEALYTVIGVGVLALGHRLNFMAAD